LQRREDYSLDQVNGAARAGYRLGVALANRWGLDEADQARMFGFKTPLEQHCWERKLRGKEIRRSDDTLYRLGLIAGIQKLIENNYAAERFVYCVKEPNAMIEGITILDEVLNGTEKDIASILLSLRGMFEVHYG